MNWRAERVECRIAVSETSYLSAGLASTYPFAGLNLQDTEGTRDEAGGLVSKCLLQDVGGDWYRVHDLVLDFVKMKIKADAEMVGKATALQAQHLGRLDVARSCSDIENDVGMQDMFMLGTLWRSVEQLSGNLGLEVASYRVSLGRLESCEATEEVADSYWSVGMLFEMQVREVSFFLGGGSRC